MNRWQQALDFGRSALDQIIGWALTLNIAVQVGVIVLAFLVALWLSPRFDRFLKARLSPHVSRLSLANLAKLIGPIELPFFWWITLSALLVIAGAMGHFMALAGAVASLLAAWVAIRLISRLVRNRVLSNILAIIAWSVAALSMLNLLTPIAHQLDAIAFEVGKFRLSLLAALQGLFVLAALLWLTTFLSGFLERRITSVETLTPSIQTLLVQISRILFPLLAVVIALAIIGVDLTALAVFSGAIGIGIGLGLQDTIKNLFAGLSLILGKAIEKGEVIAYGDRYGVVKELGARYVILQTRDGITHHVPNTHFIDTGVENWSQNSAHALRLHIPVGISYSSDLEKALKVCLDSAAAVDRVLKVPAPVCLVKEFGDSSIDLDLRIWIRDPANGVSNVKSAVMREMWRRFAVAGIQIPFPQRDIHIIPEKPMKGQESA